MGFSDKYKILIKKLAWFKRVPGYSRKKLMKEFPLKSWSKRELSYSLHIYQRQFHSVDELKRWNGSSLMSGAGSNSRFLTRLLISVKEDFERVSMLKEDTLSTACELTTLILSISVTFHVTCLTVTSLITKSCQQRWPIHSCSFYKVVHYQIWQVVDFKLHLQQWKNY